MIKEFEGFISRRLLKIKEDDIEIGDKVILTGSYAGVNLNGKESKVIDINQNPKHLYHKRFYVIKVPVEFDYKRYIQFYRTTVIKTIEIPIDNIRKVIKRKVSAEDPYGEEDWDDTNEGFLKNYRDRKKFKRSRSVEWDAIKSLNQELDDYEKNIKDASFINLPIDEQEQMLRNREILKNKIKEIDPTEDWNDGIDFDFVSNKRKNEIKN